MIDTGVPSVVVTCVRQLQAKWHRENLEKELESRTLPISMNNNHGDDDCKALELTVDAIFDHLLSTVERHLEAIVKDGNLEQTALLSEALSNLGSSKDVRVEFG